MVNDDISNRFQVIFVHHTSCRVVWEVHHQDFSLWRDVFHQRLRCDFELILSTARKSLWNSSCKIHLRLIRDKARVNNKDLVSRIYNSTHRDVKTFGNSCCEDDFRFRVILDTVTVLEILREQTAEFGKSAV